MNNETGMLGQTDPMPKRTAFIKWCDGRALDASEDKDAWGARTFKHPHIQSMWEGWFNAPTAAAAPAAGDEPAIEPVAPLPVQAQPDEALTLHDLAKEFHHAATTGTPYVLSPSSARKCFEAMTTPPDEAANKPAAPAAEQVREPSDGEIYAEVARRANAIAASTAQPGAEPVRDVLKSIIEDGYLSDSNTARGRLALDAAPAVQPGAGPVLAGFNREDLATVAEELEAMPKSVNVGDVTGMGEEHYETGSGLAARFIRAALAAPAAPTTKCGDD